MDEVLKGGTLVEGSDGEEVLNDGMTGMGENEEGANKGEGEEGKMEGMEMGLGLRMGLGMGLRLGMGE